MENFGNFNDSFLCDLFVHISSFFDARSLLNLSTASATSHALFRRRRDQILAEHCIRPPRQLLDAAKNDLGALLKQWRAQPATAPSDFLVMHHMHGVLHDLLSCIANHGPRALNILTGTDLLDSVGRLSMMIVNSDHRSRPIELEPLPVNWMTPGDVFTRTRFNEREKLQVLKGLLTSQPSLRDGAAELLRANTELSLPMQTILGYLSLDALLALASTSQSFLVTCTLAPPVGLFEDEVRQVMILQAALRTARRLREGRLTIEGIHIPQMLQSLCIGEYQLGSMASCAEALLKLSIQSCRLSVPWGDMQHIEFEMGDEGDAVRLMFKEDPVFAEILSVEKSDLSYGNIAKVIEKLDATTVTKEMRLAFRNLTNVNRCFFGELAILLVGLEGTQNNLMVLQAPMVNHLVCAGKLKWQHALATNTNQLPTIAFAGDKKKKPTKVMTKQSNLLLGLPVDYDDSTDQGKFQNFMAQQYSLHLEFLSTFYPDVLRYNKNLQLPLIALLTKHYLFHVYGVSHEMQKDVDERVHQSLLKHEYHQRLHRGTSRAPRGGVRGSPRGGLQGPPRGGLQGPPRGGLQGPPRGGLQGPPRGGNRGQLSRRSRGGKNL